MDYAKLALLKAEEIKRKDKNANAEISRTGLLCEAAVTAGDDYKICEVKGDGETGIIVSLALKFDANGGTGGGTGGGSGDTDGKIDFRISGKTVFSRPLSDSPLFMASARLSGKVTVSIRTSKAVTVVSADVMVIGGEIINSVAPGVRVYADNGVTAAVCIKDGEVRLSAGGSDSLPDLSDFAVAGFGTSAATAGIDTAEGKRLAVVIADENKNVFLTLADYLGRIESCHRLEINAESVAVIGKGARLVVGYCRGGYAYAAVFSPPNPLPEISVRLEEAASIELVRDSYPPAAILSKQGINVIRLAREEIPCDEAVKIKIVCSAGG